MPVPPLLLERDDPPAPPPAKPPQPEASHAAPPSLPRPQAEPAFPVQPSKPPELFVTARDPQWLYAHWDMSDEQVRHYNALSFEGHLSVRVHSEPGGRPPVVEAHVLPESRHWFIYVGPGAASYVAQLGYYDQQRQWRPLAASPPVQTPEPFPALAGPELFATLPLDIPLAEVAPLVEPRSRTWESVPEGLEPASVGGGVSTTGRRSVPLTRPVLTSEQRRALSLALERTEAQWRSTSSGEFLLREAPRRGESPGSDLALGANPVE